MAIPEYYSNARTDSHSHFEAGSLALEQLPGTQMQFLESGWGGPYKLSFGLCG